MGNASIMDLLLKVIACEDSTDGAGTLEVIRIIPSFLPLPQFIDSNTIAICRLYSYYYLLPTSSSPSCDWFLTIDYSVRYHRDQSIKQDPSIPHAAQITDRFISLFYYISIPSSLYSSSGSAQRIWSPLSSTNSIPASSEAPRSTRTHRKRLSTLSRSASTPTRAPAARWSPSSSPRRWSRRCTATCWSRACRPRCCMESKWLSSCCVDTRIRLMRSRGPTIWCITMTWRSWRTSRRYSGLLWLIWTSWRACWLTDNIHLPPPQIIITIIIAAVVIVLHNKPFWRLRFRTLLERSNPWDSIVWRLLSSLRRSLHAIIAV